MNRDDPKFWQLKDSLFAQSLDGNSIFHWPQLKTELDLLSAITAQAKTLTVVYGEPGSGTSTIAKWLHRNLPYSSHESLLLLPTEATIKRGWLIHHLCKFMCGDAYLGQSSKETLRRTSIALDQLIDEKRLLVVIIDNAEKLVNSTCCAELIDLFAAQAISGACLSFVLLGNKQLHSELMVNSELGALLSYKTQLPRLPEAETSGFLQFFLKTASIDSSPFTPSAVKTLAMISQGNPGIITRVADASLRECTVRRERFIDSDAVVNAARSIIPDLRITSQIKEQPPRATAESTSTKIEDPAPQDQLSINQKEEIFREKNTELAWLTANDTSNNNSADVADASILAHGHSAQPQHTKQSEDILTPEHAISGNVAVRPNNHNKDKTVDLTSLFRKSSDKKESAKDKKSGNK